ncbi:MAG: NYN domain-containing protein [Planctomycetes bacterium]|nr:NYN domain-containing protein [Planctomycetota bacterium]
MPPSYSAPLSFSPPPLSFSPPPQAPSYGTTSYGAPPTGDVGGLRREIDELRAQLQRSLTPGSAPSSLYGESAPRSQPMQVSAPMASVPNSTGSMSLFAAQRVAIIADVPSLQRTAKKQFGRVVSFTKLMSSVLRGRGAVRAMAFLAERDASDPSFMSHLRSAGFEIRRSDVGVEMLRRPDAAASLPLEASRLANRVDCIVLAGSDPELLALIPALRSQGCRVELASFPDVGPESMRESTDSYLALGREELI